MDKKPLIKFRSQAEAANLFLKNHDQHERKLLTAITNFFDDQAERVSLEILNYSAPSPEIVDAIFDIESENRRFLKHIGTTLFVTMGRGAADVLSEVDQDEPDEKTFDFGNLPTTLFQLPNDVLQMIRMSLNQLAAQPYWIGVQRTSRDILVNILKDGIERGANAQRIARRIRVGMGGKAAHKRALKIARTETTLSLNAGHQVAAESLVREGLTVVKVWSTTRDSDAREDHLSANGQRVAVGAEFILGGYSTPFPGHYSLPARQRINCRCGTRTRVIDYD